jgi:RimJ/RimL family protein N-acetyltransferase
MMEIFTQGQAYMRSHGIAQWQNGYPSEELIRHDMEQGYSYVLLRDGMVVSTVAVSFDGEPTYQLTYEGNWIIQEDYAVVHRIAIDDRIKGAGMAGYMLREIEELCRNKRVNSIRIDTHADNLSMQRLMDKSGFTYCGIIYLEDGAPRIAYEKRVTSE